MRLIISLRANGGIGIRKKKLSSSCSIWVRLMPKHCIPYRYCITGSSPVWPTVVCPNMAD